MPTDHCLRCSLPSSDFSFYYVAGSTFQPLTVYVSQGPRGRLNSIFITRPVPFFNRSQRRRPRDSNLHFFRRVCFNYIVLIPRRTRLMLANPFWKWKPTNGIFIHWATPFTMLLEERGNRLQQMGELAGKQTREISAAYDYQIVARRLG